MLARIEEALHSRRERRVEQKMTAIDSVLQGLIDYAGLYPPASLDMRTALCSYLGHAKSKHAAALGRFIVDLNRLSELRNLAGNSLRNLKVSVIGPATADWDSLPMLLDDGVSIEAVEIKTDEPAEIDRITTLLPSGLDAYFEVPLQANIAAALDDLSAAGVRAKLRMGGVVADAFPSAEAIAQMLSAFSMRRVPFKATAGLHYPIRSRHLFTYAPDSPTGTMHGFVNLVCAAALIHFGGDEDEARVLLNEEDPAAWNISPDTIAWRSFQWSTEQLREVRQQFFISIGSCSFVEPMHGLEALGWL
jgi:hypothetical protein